MEVSLLMHLPSWSMYARTQKKNSLCPKQATPYGYFNLLPKCGTYWNKDTQSSDQKQEIYTKCFKKVSLLKLKEIVFQKAIILQWVAGVRNLKSNVFNSTWNERKYRFKRFARFVCASMNKVQKHNELVIPQKVEGVLRCSFRLRCRQWKKKEKQ